MNVITPFYKIAYYTGTGGSEKVAESFDQRLKSNGCTGDIEKITTGDSHNLIPHDLLILIFPVHAFNAPEAVYKWIDSLERADKIPAAIISVSGGGEVFPNTACRQSSIRRLKKKGYNVVYEDMIVMPSNWITATKEPLAVMLLQVLPDKVNFIINEVLSGMKKRTAPIFLDRIFSRLGEIEKPAARFWGARIRVSLACSGCGLCSRQCPAGNITMINGNPAFGHKCHLCLKCIYACRESALKPGFAEFIIVKDGYNLNKIEKKVPLKEPLDLEKEAKGYLWSGVKRYLMELNPGKNT